MTYEGDWGFVNSDVSDGYRVQGLQMEKESKNPWSYVVYEDQNCSGKFFNQSSSTQGMNMAVVDWAKQSIHTSLDYHVKIMEAPSSIEIDNSYYMLYARNLDNNWIPYFQTGYYNIGMYAMDSENFSEAIY